jgi:hypothetical protein
MDPPYWECCTRRPGCSKADRPRRRVRVRGTPDSVVPGLSPLRARPVVNRSRHGFHVHQTLIDPATRAWQVPRSTDGKPTRVHTCPHSVGRVLLEGVSGARLTEHPVKNVNNSPCRSVPMAIWTPSASDGSSGSPTHSRAVTYIFGSMLTNRPTTGFDDFLVDCGGSLATDRCSCWTTDAVDDQRSANSLWR